MDADQNHCIILDQNKIDPEIGSAEPTMTDYCIDTQSDELNKIDHRKRDLSSAFGAKNSNTVQRRSR